MERKYIGLDKNIAFGLSYLFPIIAIIILVADHDLDTEDKRILVSSILNIVASSITCGIFGIIAIVVAIKNFMGDTECKLPLLYSIASSIIK